LGPRVVVADRPQVLERRQAGIRADLISNAVEAPTVGEVVVVGMIGVAQPGRIVVRTDGVADHRLAVERVDDQAGKSAHLRPRVDDGRLPAAVHVVPGELEGAGVAVLIGDRRLTLQLRHRMVAREGGQAHMPAAVVASIRNALRRPFEAAVVRDGVFQLAPGTGVGDGRTRTAIGRPAVGKEGQAAPIAGPLALVNDDPLTSVRVAVDHSPCGLRRREARLGVIGGDRSYAAGAGGWPELHARCLEVPCLQK